MYPRPLLFTVAAIALTACGEVAQLPVAAGVGPHPQLPPPNPTLIPTVNIAQAVGWPANRKPLAGPGMAVNAFAGGLDHPRWLTVLPNGDVLVAETNAPSRPKDAEGIRGWFMKRVMNKAGAGVPSANRITLLRDADGDGVAETRSVFIEGLNSPFGMALIGNDFYVANSDAVVRFPYTEGEIRIAQPGTKVLDLPAGPINHHWTKNLIASRDEARLYVTVGSNSNAAENGIDQEVGRAAIWEVDPKRGSYRIYASGLRNPNGLAWEPGSGLPDFGTRRQLLRLALQLLWSASGRTGAASAARPGRQGQGAGLCNRAAHRFARPGLFQERSMAGAIRQRSFHWSARFMES